MVPHFSSPSRGCRTGAQAAAIIGGGPLPSLSGNGTRSNRPPGRPVAGFTLLEVMVAMLVFILSSLGFTYSYQMLNSRAARVRCDTAAQAILRSKVAKALTEPWIPLSVPVDCVVTSGQQPATADPNDPYDVGPTVVLQSQSGSPQLGLVTGTLYRNTYVFESAPKTVVIDYQLTYVFRGTTYNCYASTVRAADK